MVTLRHRSRASPPHDATRHFSESAHRTKACQGVLLSKLMCAACCLSKTGRASTLTTQVLDTSEKNLNDTATIPGDVIHLHQYMSGLPGRPLPPLGKRSPRRNSQEAPSSFMVTRASCTTTIKFPCELEKHCKARIDLRKVRDN
jgi:hypothetical protein